MKNVVIFETARALKEAGFPQPEPEAGQVWYCTNFQSAGNIVLITEIDCLYRGVYITQEAVSKWTPISFGTDYPQNFVDFQAIYIFAPTATDILRELPETSLLSRIENDFQCRVMSPDFRQRCEYAIRDPSPTEACAAAYLEINKTPTGEIIAIAGERLNAGDWVSLDVDGTVKKAQPPETPTGFAGEDIPEGETIVLNENKFWNKIPKP